MPTLNFVHFDKITGHENDTVSIYADSWYGRVHKRQQFIVENTTGEPLVQQIFDVVLGDGCVIKNLQTDVEAQENDDKQIDALTRSFGFTLQTNAKGLSFNASCYHKGNTIAGTISDIMWRLNAESEWQSIENAADFPGDPGLTQLIEVKGIVNIPYNVEFEDLVWSLVAYSTEDFANASTSVTQMHGTVVRTYAGMPELGKTSAAAAGGASETFDLTYTTVLNDVTIETDVPFEDAEFNHVAADPHMLSITKIAGNQYKLTFINNESTDVKTANIGLGRAGYSDDTRWPHESWSVSQNAGAKVFYAPTFVVTPDALANGTVLHDASAGSVQLGITNINQTYRWNNVGTWYDDDYVVSDVSITWVSANASIASVNESSGLLTFAANETTSDRSVIIQATVGLHNVYAAEQYTAVQAADVVDAYGDIIIDTYTVNDIPASGGSVSSAANISWTQTQTWRSGRVLTLTKPGSVSYSSAISGSNLSTTVKARTNLGTLTATVTANGKSATANVDVYQAANVATYGNVSAGTISASDIPASGGTRSATMSGGSQTVTYTSRASRAGSISHSQTTAVSASNLTTTVKARTAIGTITGTFIGEGGKSTTASVTVYQAANTQTTTGITIGTYQPDPTWIGADTPTNMPAATCYVGIRYYWSYSYTSGSTNTSGWSGNMTSGLTIVSNPENMAVLYPRGGIRVVHRYTTVGNARSCTVRATLSGFTSNTLTLTQRANAVTNTETSYDGTVSVSISANAYTSSSSPCSGDGGRCTLSYRASQAGRYRYTYTSGSHSYSGYDLSTSRTPTISGSATGFSLSGTTVTIAANEGDARSCTYTASYGGVSKSVTIYQAEGAQGIGKMVIGSTFKVF